jgi:hypothetical protein
MTPKEKANQLVDKFDTFDVLGENHNGFTANNVHWLQLMK